MVLGGPSSWWKFPNRNGWTFPGICQFSEPAAWNPPKKKTQATHFLQNFLRGLFGGGALWASLRRKKFYQIGWPSKSIYRSDRCVTKNPGNQQIEIVKSLFFLVNTIKTLFVVFEERSWLERSTWNAKCPIFSGNFTPKTSNYCLKNRALGFPGMCFCRWLVRRFTSSPLLTCRRLMKRPREWRG